MQQFQNILFDLDGTIIDSHEGITRSVEYALNHLGSQVKDRNSLLPFIGPPLLDSFKNFYRFDNDTAQRAVQKYRERYSKKGIYESELYQGVEPLLKALKQKGLFVGIATCKPELFARQILEYLQVAHYFDFIGGCDLEGKLHTKADVLHYVINSNQLNLEETLLVGDRKYDIIGAKEVGLPSVGVLYGFGSEKELQEAGSTFICPDMLSLSNFLLK